MQIIKADSPVAWDAASSNQSVLVMENKSCFNIQWPGCRVQVWHSVNKLPNL